MFILIDTDDCVDDWRKLRRDCAAARGDEHQHGVRSEPGYINTSIYLSAIEIRQMYV